MTAKSLRNYLLLSIVLCLGLLFTLRLYPIMREGFSNASPEQAAYESLRSNLKTTMAPYCEIANLVQTQMIDSYKMKKFSDSGEPLPGESESEAQAHLMQTYSNVYACTDELNALRSQCNSPAESRSDWKYIPCSTYIDIPAYTQSDTTPMIMALVNIPDSTPEKIQMELAWYDSVIKKLQSGLDAGATPPTSLPKDASGNLKISKEGFYDVGKCSPEAMAIKVAKMMELKKRESQEAARKSVESTRKSVLAESESCSVPDLPSEIKRVNAILENPKFTSALKQSKAIYASAKKLQSDMAKLQAGSLYSWQQGGATRTYTKFQGGDRIAAFLASAVQNRDFSY